MWFIQTISVSKAIICLSVARAGMDPENLPEADKLNEFQLCET